jgi:hypothetical protein
MSPTPLADQIYEAIKANSRIGRAGICRAVKLPVTRANKIKISRTMAQVEALVAQRQPGKKLGRYPSPAENGQLLIFQFDDLDTAAARKLPITKVRQSLSIQQSAARTLATTGTSGLMAKMINSLAESTAVMIEVLVELDTGS